MNAMQPPSNDLVSYSAPPSLSSLQRYKGLRKLGVSEDDVHLAEKLLASSSLAKDKAKALRLLGTTEEEVDLENSKMLGSLGIAGRRRSHSIAGINHSEILAFAKVIPRARASTMVSKMRQDGVLRRRSTTSQGRHGRRRSSTGRRRSSSGQRSVSSDTEIRRLRTQAKASANEIKALTFRLEELEKRLARSGAAAMIPTLIDS